jgi:hypothetical protein
MNPPFPGYDDMEELRQWLDNRENPCGHIGAYAEFPTSNPTLHFAHYRCYTCGEKAGFAPRPQTKEEAKKRRPSLKLTRLDEDRCIVCLANRMEANLLGRTLEAHHLIDRALLIEAGYPPDELKHLAWACSNPCHQIVTALRLGTASALTMAGAFGVSDDG